MRARRLLVLFLLAVAGYGTVALLAPRFNPTTTWHHTLDREAAVTRAREEAQLSGIDASGWRAIVTSAYQDQIVYFLTHHPASATKAMLVPVLVRVLLVEPDGLRRRWHVTLTADGRLDGFTFKEATPEDAAQTRTEQPAVNAERRREIAAASLARLVGGEAAQFSLVSEIDEKAAGFRYIWERSIPGEEDFKLRVISLVHHETVRELQLITNLSPRQQDIYANRRNATRWIDLLEVFLIVVLITTVAGLYIFCWIRGEINHRLALTLFAVLVLFGVVRAVFTGMLDSQLTNNYQTGGAHLTLFGVALGLILPAVFIALLVTLFWTTGYAFARRAKLQSSATFAALLRGRLLDRLTARRIAAGLLLGGILAAIPLLVAASGLFPALQLDPPDHAYFTSRAPVLAAVMRYFNPTFLVVFGLLVPLAAAFLRRPQLARLLPLPLGAFLMLDETVYQSSLGGALTIVALTILVAEQIFRRFDFLTLIAAGLAADVSESAWSFIVQPTATHQGVGWRALATLGVVLVVALLVGWKGRDAEATSELEDERERAASTALQRAERERLMAEFGVARLAQQHMLPDVPPRIAGYDISATCRPAREVGGDLYDFLVLPNERIGIVVADVSGKGVPAALYMTLTKGLLASVAENESDPAAILREVNRHLYEVCRRKVFVTMLLGVLEPATQTLTYARAGHNPGIWRRTSQQASQLLRAAGMGLGLSSSKLFNRSLKSESVRVERGDAVLLYSDGITEAMNAQGEEYGEERLLEAVARTDGLDAAATQEAILADVSAFLGETSPQDDITLVVVRVAEG